MDATKREIRTIECELAVREAAPDAQGESRTIVGTAIVFNSESEVLDEYGMRFREVIKPEAAQMAFLNTQDIKMNLLHERSMAIARCKEGRGSLKLSVDGKGVNFEFEAPKCDIGDRALELVRTGVYSGCSFEFIPDQYEVEERGGSDNKEVRIIHKRFKAITALTIGMDPAYRATSVNARELWNETPTAKREAQEAQRKADEEKRLQEERERHEKALAQEREKIKMLQEQRRREMDLDNFSY